MNDLLQDTWHELREKRLWPVALLLVAAVVAIPLLMTKSAAAPPAAAPAPVVPPAEETAAVELDEGDAASTGAGSSLERFAENDPFTPPGAIARAGGSGTDRATLPSSGEAKGDAGGGEDGGTTLPGAAPDQPTRIAPPQTRTDTAEYEYVADVTFWAGERRRTLEGLRKLDMLPNQSAPVLIFMGTAGNGGDAVFLVDSTLEAAGEGRCVPSQANCAYVHLGAGAEHAFSTQEGDSYRLRVDEIRRVEVGAAAAARRPAASSSASGAVRRFELPSLVDLVAVTETTTSRSSVAADGR